MKLHPLYKKFLLLAIVIGPFYWLVFTEDGQRRTDSVLISLLKGGESFNLAFGRLQGAAREADFQASFPDTEFRCEDGQTAFGDRVCRARIAAFNGAPAHSVATFFRQDQLTAVQLVYQPAHHDYVVQQLQRELGKPEADQAGTTPLHRWTTDGGVVITPATRPASLDESTVVWISAAQAAMN
jgi:hypothetical protein